MIPRRSIFLAGFVGVSSLAWFVSARVQGLNSGGAPYTLVTALASGTFLAATALLIFRAQARPSLSASGLVHLVLFAWLFTYAYTWFGEVP
jgi:hypothetical protein